MIAAPLVAFVNHLLRSEPHARERLAPFTGKRVRVTAPPLPGLHMTVVEGGLLEVRAEGAADVTISLTPAAFPGLFRRDENTLRGIDFTGDAELAAALQFLFRHLEWNAEEDLSRIVGDVAAHRVASMGRDLLAWQKEAAERFGHNLAEYFTEEAGVIAPPADLARFAREIAEVRDAVERLEKRIDRIAAAIQR
jgi:ubiquinone biosynthesis protein UbiJ